MKVKVRKAGTLDGFFLFKRFEPVFQDGVVKFKVAFGRAVECFLDDLFSLQT